MPTKKTDGDTKTTTPRRGRQKTAPAGAAAAGVDDGAIIEATAAHDELHQRLVVIDEQYGDGLPYDRGRLVHEAKFFMAQAAEAAMDLGRRLVLLKEHEPHGEFLTALSEIGLAPRAAQKMMQAAVKFSNAPALAHLGRTKLLELMTEDDEELEALAEGGTLHGLTLDDVDKMTTRELKDALRTEREEAKANEDAKDRIIKDKTDKIEEMHKEAARRQGLTGDELSTEQSAQLERDTMATLGDLLQLDATIGQILDRDDCPAHLRTACAQQHQRIKQRVADLETKFALVVDSDIDDSWMDDGTDGGAPAVTN